MFPKKNMNPFTTFLDEYSILLKNNTSFHYQSVLSCVQMHYTQQRLYDEHMVGKGKHDFDHLVKNSINPSNIANNPSIFSPWYVVPCSTDQSANAFSYFSNTIQEGSGNPAVWYYQMGSLVPPPSCLSEIVNPEPIVEKEFVQIDIVILSLSDLIRIIEENPIEKDKEYNIDLQSLHNIKDELMELDGMVGMKILKQNILDQLLYFIQQLHLGKKNSEFKHTVLYGSPGTGKTEVAKIIGKMYSKMGILKNNMFKKVTRHDLIAGYLGQTALKTKKVIDECLGGVLFIDEAYSLANSEGNDTFSKECIDTICEALSDYKDELMVIIAGYEEELNGTFFQMNKGLASRFIWRFTMDSYTPNEMMQIFKKMVIQQEWMFSDESQLTEKWFQEKKDQFKNYGRDMELLLTYTKIAHSKRIYGKDKNWRKRISVEDMNGGYHSLLKNRKDRKEPSFMHSIYV